MSAPAAAPHDTIERLDQVWTRPPGVFGWIAAVNHKAIGTRYLVTATAFFVLAGSLALAMRLQLARPERDVLSAELFNQFFTVHGTAMMFLFAVPILEGIGMYLVPLMIGTRDMAFPRLNALGYWVFLIAGVTLFASQLFGAAPDGGWFAYTPLTNESYSPAIGLDIWVTAITLLEVAALVAAVELIVTILKFRAEGMSLSRAPLFVWAQLVMSAMIVFAMPPLILASVLLALDRLVGTHFFDVAAGGDPLLWQHLFWIFGHPEVYIIFVPALGIVSMVVPVAARRPVIGYTLLVLSFIAIGFVSFGLWVHHLYATGLPFLGLGFFAAASMMIAIPSGVQIFAYLATIWHGRPRLTTAFLFVLGFVFVFVIGGMTGVMVAAVPFDWQVHDSYFVVAHFHYVLIGGAVFPLFAGAYHWFPKLTGRRLSERLGKWSFWLMFIGVNLTFFPMHELGMAGMPRRIYTYAAGLGWDDLNLLATIGAFTLALGIAATLVNGAWSLALGPAAGDDPWSGDTLEWATGSPPPSYNFAVLPRVRSRYPLWYGGGGGDGAGAEPERVLLDPEEPRRETLATTILDARPEFRRILPGPSTWPLFVAVALAVVFIGSLIDLILVPVGAALAFIGLVGWLWPNRQEWKARPAIGGAGELPAVVSGTRAPEWWGILSLIVIEGVVFLSLIASYFYLRFGAAEWPLSGIEPPDLLLPTLNTVLLVASAAPVWWGTRRIRAGDERRLRTALVAGIVLLATFLALKFVEYAGYDYDWATNAYGSIVFTITGLHMAHVIAVLLKGGTVAVMAWRGYFDGRQYVPVEANALYWYFVVGIWIPLYATIYLSPRLALV